MNNYRIVSCLIVNIKSEKLQPFTDLSVFLALALGVILAYKDSVNKQTSVFLFTVQLSLRAKKYERLIQRIYNQYVNILLGNYGDYIYEMSI